MQDLALSTLSEYLLLIEPRHDLSDQIMAIKEKFAEQYKSPQTLKGKPHLTLVSFVQYAAMEGRIKQTLRRIATERSPMLIEMADFGSFPSHTIYINVVSKPVIQALVKAIRTELQSMLKPDKDHPPHFIMEPHITIARRLVPWQYEQGWLQYSHQSFSGKCMATNMILLKKEAGDQNYRLADRFEFLSRPGGATQARLF